MARKRPVMDFWLRLISAGSAFTSNGKNRCATSACLMSAAVAVAGSVMLRNELSGAMGAGGINGVTTDPRHMAIGAQDGDAAVASVQTVSAGGKGDPRASGMNNVDLDQEMAELAKTQLRFRFSARMIGDTFRNIQASIRGTQ